MGDVGVVEVLSVLEVLQPVLAECFALLVWLRKKSCKPTASRIVRGTTNPKNAVTGSEPRQANTVKARPIEDGGRVSDALRDVLGHVEKADGRFSHGAVEGASARVSSAK